MATHEPGSIEASALAPGDVLLSRGVGEVADLICAIDGGSYSHAGIWTGTQVVHATFDGIVRDALSATLLDRQYVDVARFAKDGHALGSARWPAEPVLGCALAYVGGSYAYSDLLMLALLIGYGRRPGVPALDSAVRKLGAHLADRLDAWLQRQAGARDGAAPAPMTCSELVGRAFFEAKAEPAHAYALEVVLPGRAPLAPPMHSVPDPAAQDLESVAAACRDVVRRRLPALDADLRARARAEDAPPDPPALLGLTRARGVIAGSRALPLRTLTPRDLETSPTLARVGRLAQA